MSQAVVTAGGGSQAENCWLLRRHGAAVGGDGFQRMQDWEGDWLTTTLVAVEALARRCLDLLLIPRWSRRLEAVLSTGARWSRRWLAGRVTMLLAESQGGPRPTQPTL
jgi:hypothetical protein